MIAQAADVGSLVAALRNHRPRIVLLDIDDDVLAVGRMVATLHAVGPRVRILLLSSDRTPVFIRHVMRAGAAGYVLREAAIAELSTAVRIVAMGRSYLDPQLGAELAGEAEAPSTATACGSPGARRRSCGSSRSGTRTPRSPIRETDTAMASFARIYPAHA